MSNEVYQQEINLQRSHNLSPSDYNSPNETVERVGKRDRDSFKFERFLWLTKDSCTYEFQWLRDSNGFVFASEISQFSISYAACLIVMLVFSLISSNVYFYSIYLLKVSLSRNQKQIPKFWILIQSQQSSLNEVKYSFILFDFLKVYLFLKVYNLKKEKPVKHIIH